MERRPSHSGLSAPRSNFQTTDEATNMPSPLNSARKQRSRPTEPVQDKTARKYALRIIVLVALAAGAFLAAYGLTRFRQSQANRDDPPGMMWIPGGEFTMGSNAADASIAEK